MGCSLSTVSRSKLSLKNDEIHTNSVRSCLTDRHKHIIKKTWKRVSNDMPGVGAKIFLMIFAIKPAIKQIFPFHDVTGDALLRDTHFRGHASRFMQAVGAAVDNINALDTAMAPLLFTLGQQHVNYKGFSEEYFGVFSVAITQVLGQELGTSYTTEVSSAWSNMLEFMISKLRDGYRAALQE